MPIKGNMRTDLCNFVRKSFHKEADFPFFFFFFFEETLFSELMFSSKEIILLHCILQYNILSNVLSSIAKNFLQWALRCFLNNAAYVTEIVVSYTKRFLTKLSSTVRNE
jgi:hypothetical protein